jgi:acyl carrier protein
LTANGKVDRRALPDPEWFLSQRQDAYVEPRSEVQRTLASIWCELLGVDQVGLQDDFFNLGGHSLLAVQVVSRIRDRLGVELELRQLFEAPTIEELAQQIEPLPWLGKGEGSAAPGERERGHL